MGDLGITIFLFLYSTENEPIQIFLPFFIEIRKVNKHLIVLSFMIQKYKLIEIVVFKNYRLLCFKINPPHMFNITASVNTFIALNLWNTFRRKQTLNNTVLSNH